MDELQQQIAEARQAGKTDEEIYQLLLTSGWDEAMINQQLSSSQPQAKAASEQDYPSEIDSQGIEGSWPSPGSAE